MKTIYEGISQEDAIVLRSMLQSAGIPAELLSGGKLEMNPLFNVDVADFSLVVTDEYVTDARAVVADFRASRGAAAGKQTDTAGPAVGARATEHRRALHRIPEIGLELPRTLAYVRSALTAAGLRPKDCGPGIICDIGTSGPLVAIRADMDALPIAEETGLPFASEITGAMHACGHDAHTGTLLAVAEHLAAKPPARHRIRLIFQPGEEGFFGARAMIEAGCLDGVVAIVGGHVGDLSEELEPGQAGFLPGPMMAASDRFAGAFIGSGGHGSAPHQAKDPIPALAHFILAVQSFRARRPDQRKPFVLSVCEVSAGSAFNIIPGKASYRGTARTLEPAERALAREGLEAAAKGAAIACGLDYEFEWMDGYPPLANDPEATALAMAAAVDVLGSGAVKELTVPSMGGEDFAYYLARVPGCFWFLDTQSPDRGLVHPNHHPRFDVDESRLSDLAAINLGAAAALAKRFG